MNMIIRRQLQLKAKEKKGFTLVEVIVVLVILAILMAIAIPALTGYIDRANQRGVMAEARNVQVALQTIGSDAYGTNNTIAANGVAGTSNIMYGTTDSGKTFNAEITALTGMDLSGVTIAGIKFTGKNVLSGFTYKDGNITATYANGTITVA